MNWMKHGHFIIREWYIRLPISAKTPTKIPSISIASGFAGREENHYWSFLDSEHGHRFYPATTACSRAPYILVLNRFQHREMEGAVTCQTTIYSDKPIMQQPLPAAPNTMTPRYLSSASKVKHHHRSHDQTYKYHKLPQIVRFMVKLSIRWFITMIWWRVARAG